MPIIASQMQRQTLKRHWLSGLLISVIACLFSQTQSDQTQASEILPNNTPPHHKPPFNLHLTPQSATLLWPKPATLAAKKHSAQPSSQFKPLAFSILKTHNHDPNAFTQGWVMDKTDFYESSGLYGKSFIVRYMQDNQVKQRYTFPKALFAEGLTLFKKELFALTWQKGIVFVFEPKTLKIKRTHRYTGEGWGLTHNNKQLIMSNGTNQLYFRNARDFAKVRALTVKGGNINWQRLNELEYAKGIIWANIWQTTLIAAINPINGNVMGTVDLNKLVKANTQKPRHQTLNGIAYDAAHDAFWITGKHWPKRYLIKIQTPTNSY